MKDTEAETGNEVLRLQDIDGGQIEHLLARMGLIFRHVGAPEDIPGSYWGDEEAGLIGNQLLARNDTPVHSILHEACHYVCMDETRRSGLHTDAGGDYDEENGVCYLQILLAALLPAMGRTRMMHDMDTWGYTFRLGSARAWFESDAGDAREWLSKRNLINEDGEPMFLALEN